MFRPQASSHNMHLLRSFVVIGLNLALSNGCATPRGDPAPPPRNPRAAVTSSESFSAADIPRYTGSHAAAYEYIDRNQAAHLEHLRRWVKQPSVSAQNIGIAEMAGMLIDDLRKLGFQETELVPTAGHPGVWGFFDAGAEKTLAVYMMYDV